jgi:hypothetical protein
VDLEDGREEADMRRIIGAATFAAGAIVAYRKVVRPWHERWGATDEEVRAPLPGMN